MKVMIVGDTHANIENMNNVLLYAAAEKVDQIIQLGDFGWWPRWNVGIKFINFVTATVKQLNLAPIIFIPGNHEDYEDLRDVYKIPSLHRMNDQIMMAGRGYVCKLGDKTVLMIGGGCSVDKAIRTEGLDWFPEEEISQRECYNLCAHMNEYGKVDVLLSHDVIDGINPGINLIEGYGNVRRALRSVCDISKPDRIIHGHYHIRYWVYENIWGHVTRIDGLSHDSASFHNHYIIEDW